MKMGSPSSSLAGRMHYLALCREQEVDLPELVTLVDVKVPPSFDSVGSLRTDIDLPISSSPASSTMHCELDYTVRPTTEPTDRACNRPAEVADFAST